jgi:hypothetical protein
MEVWSGTLIIIAACIILRQTTPGPPRTVVFIGAILAALYLIVVSIGHAKRKDG